MSLAITAVTPSGIVVAADSAVTTEVNGEEIVLTSFPKVILRPRPTQAFAIIGDLRIGAQGADSWAHLWLNQFLSDLAPTTNLGETARELAVTLNATPSSGSGGAAIIGAAWEHISRAEDTRSDIAEEVMMPAVWEVSTGASGGEFDATQLLRDEDVRENVQAAIKSERGEGRSFPVQFFHAGVPKGFGTWIVGEGRERFAAFANDQLPSANIEGVEEYVRFAIKLAAELYAVSGQLRYVAEPIHTAILFPKNRRPTVYRTTR
ncbi:MAG: hypothetical protein QF744_07330 [SAR202 cluster bacterium]|nr:hypothetical protein [SAR202 cluster bacterium]MDP6799627.1 hypothetical protein [SAR202 cluster bacterium]